MTMGLVRGMTSLNTRSRKRKVLSVKQREDMKVELRKHNKRLRQKHLHSLQMTLDEYIDYLAFKSTSKNSLCNKYVFEFGAYLRKPLWTYACIDKNIDIEMICYSVNDSLTFNKNKGYF